MKTSTKIIPTSYGAGVRKDSNNCVVRAAANCTGKDYDWLHMEAKKNGRKDGKGCVIDTVIKFHAAVGIKLVGIYGTTVNASVYTKKLQCIPKKGITLGRFIKENPRGRFIIGYRGHHTCVVDGQVIDSFSQDSGKFICSAWTF